ncbi:hypothetical protein QBC36DRAFT_364920 [Triangularia setosa]|uniref:Heterokaryon incompatibility domain-containing protein n=1 Tax=Triangularia setosa TaxID=2587417 RepID=A0AAN7A3D0_9PEZI|nr:hypothetical protein QBC36DRAFT_364920 [Podospora setosa]
MLLTGRFDISGFMRSLKGQNSPFDNKFAQQLVFGLPLRVPEIYPAQLSQARLCETCANYNLYEPQFNITDDLAELEFKRALCDFCKLRWEAFRFNRDQSMLKLIQTKATEAVKYIVLSHPWGQGHSFCTFPHNLAKHKSAIPVHRPDFPDTFRDAIAATRALGIQYLWIDYMHIQDPNGGFDKEAKRMEDVFIAAYCVIAGNSARGQRDKFLKTRKERQFLHLPGTSTVSTQNGSYNGGLYICRFIDNFFEHERALVCRMIYFTYWQTYWECGCGVRCETLTKIDNKLTSFLGDPSFPSKLSSSLSDKDSDRGERIRFFEDLYRQYSRLNFTRLIDRPVAIAELEQRMINDLKAKGGLLPWSLLRRNYLDLSLGGVGWRNEAVLDPFSFPDSADQGPANETAVLRAMTRPFVLEPIGEPWESVDVILDSGNSQDDVKWEQWKAVVGGARRIVKRESVPMEPRTHYLLIITALGEHGGQDTVYRRIGVGYMAGGFLGEEEVKE